MIDRPPVILEYLAKVSKFSGLLMIQVQPLKAESRKGWDTIPLSRQINFSKFKNITQNQFPQPTQKPIFSRLA